MISSINLLTFISIGFGAFGLGLDDGLRLGSRTGLSLGRIRGFEMGLGVGLGIGFIGSGNFVVSNFSLFPLRENFTFLLGTGWSNNVFSNDLFLNLLMRFSIALYIAYRFFFKL